MGVNCLKCGHVEEAMEIVASAQCRQCGAAFLPPPPAAPPKPTLKTGGKSPRAAIAQRESHGHGRTVIYGALLLYVTTIFLACFHVIGGSTHGWKVVPKEFFSYSETFINADKIIGMTALAAKAQFPQSIVILQREGIIEADNNGDKERSDKIKSKVLTSNR